MPKAGARWHLSWRAAAASGCCSFYWSSVPSSSHTAGQLHGINPAPTLVRKKTELFWSAVGTRALCSRGPVLVALLSWSGGHAPSPWTSSIASSAPLPLFVLPFSRFLSPSLLFSQVRVVPDYGNTRGGGRKEVREVPMYMFNQTLALAHTRTPSGVPQLELLLNSFLFFVMKHEVTECLSMNVNNVYVNFKS